MPTVKEGIITLGAGFLGKGITLLDPSIDTMFGTANQPVLQRASTWVDLLTGGALLAVGVSGKLKKMKELESFISATGAFLLASKAIDMGAELSSGAAAPFRAAPVRAGVAVARPGGAIPQYPNGRLITID